MAYAESTIGGTYGGSFRVWVNSIRTYDGSPAENFEDWRVEGGINRVSATGNRIWSDGASYTTQLGLNGVAVSSGFTYDFNTATGTKISWGTGSTRVYRNGAGEGFGFTSRTDVNLNNSPILTTGWVTAGAALNTKYRHASLTALSTDAGGIPFTDEGPAWVEFSNPSGASVDAWLEIPGTGRIFTSSGGQSSRYNYTFDSTLMNAIQAASPNSNTYTIRIGIHDALGGDNWDWRDRTGTIKNDAGQANPTFEDFDYVDTNPATVAVTGNDQVLIQNRSTLQATVASSDKATPNKNATMSSYTFLLGSYSQSEPYSSSADVTKNIGTVSVTGTQNLSVRAVDSRGNSKTVTKSVTVLPYGTPGYYQALEVKYTNDFDETGGITVRLLNDQTLAAISPLTLAGVNKNDVDPVSGVQWDISKGNDTSYSGVWKNIASTVASNGYVNIDPEDLQDDILGAMTTLGVDNTVRWYIKFRVTDKLHTSTFQVYIDIGRPLFRIGSDNVLYYREFPITNPVVRSTDTTSSLAIDTRLQGTRRFTALASALNIGVPTNPYDGQRIMYCIKDNGTSRALTWDSIFVPIGVSLPTATVPNKWMYVGTIYNEAASVWHVVAVNMQA